MNPFTTQSPRNLAVALAWALFLVPFAGRSMGIGGGGSDTTDADVPPIYVAQTLVLKENGVPVVERSYRQRLKDCHDAGMATTPLGDDEVKKLGRTYYQLWFDAGRSAWQEDIWDFDGGDGLANACQFHLTHEANKVVDTIQGRLSIDLIAGTVVNEEGDGFVPGGHEGLDDDDQLDPGSAELGFQRLGYASAAGHRCLRWRSPLGIESCTWSEGRRWGFTRAERSGQVTGTYDASVIVLWAHPADGNGGELTTQKMTVGGQPFDDALFEPPSGATVRDAAP